MFYTSSSLLILSSYFLFHSFDVLGFFYTCFFIYSDQSLCLNVCCIVVLRSLSTFEFESIQPIPVLEQISQGEFSFLEPSSFFSFWAVTLKKKKKNTTTTTITTTITTTTTTTTTTTSTTNNTNNN